MRVAHSLGANVNLDIVRSFFAVVEQGSLNKAAERLRVSQSTLTRQMQAAERLRVSQSTLTRQMQALEHEVGGPLLDRSSGGVSLTTAGHAFLDGMRPVMAKFDAVLGDVRQRARGQSAGLRIGYLMSAASEYLNPALAVLRKAHPEVRVKMADLSPGEQITALRRGEIDVGLFGPEGVLWEKEFYVRKIAVLPVLVALAEDHPLAASAAVKLGDLRKEVFVGAHDHDLPGNNPWIMRLCKRAGFRARFVEDADSLTHALSMVVTEGAVLLLPDYMKRQTVPGVVFRALLDADVKWALLVAWQRGKTSSPLKTLLAALSAAK